MDQKKISELVIKITLLNRIKENEEYDHKLRLRAEDESFECYEQLLQICDGDRELVSRLLGQKEWFEEKKKQFP
jgi:hypothetical protein